jgi:hypothetical protein
MEQKIRYPAAEKLFVGWEKVGNDIKIIESSNGKCYKKQVLAS